MTVSVGEPGIHESTTDADSCPFVFADATHPDGLDPVPVLRGLISLVNERGETECPDDDGLSPMGSRPSALPRGPAASIFYDGDADLTVAWCRGLAEELSRAGWSGRIEPIPWQPWPESVSTGLSMTVVLAVAGYGVRPNRTVYQSGGPGPSRQTT